MTWCWLSSQIFEYLRETFRRHAFEYEYLLHGGQYDTKYVAFE